MKQIILGFVVLLLIAGAVIAFQKVYVTSDVPGTTPSPRPNLIVHSPKPNATVTNPIRVTGEGMAFESTFSYRLRDANGKILYENNAMLKGFEYPKYGTFDFKIAIPPNPTAQLTLEVFEYSAKDGAVTNLVRVPVQMANDDTTKVQAYFLNDTMDPQQTCTQVFPVERIVPKTKEVAFVAVSELLRGITPVEKNAKYVTALPERVAINSLVISDGVARIDFNYALDSGIGGSCRVSAIRAQIAQTLKQFSNVKEVIISREGNTEEVLQP
ncbi:MAG: Gmad2 immunoglobulin-like domain-containing protein [Patescibacteria group bacterium]